MKLKKRIVTAVGVLVAILMTTVGAQAVPVLSGNTGTIFNTDWTATVDYAVYAPSDPAVIPYLGSTTIDYAYFYKVNVLTTTSSLVQIHSFSVGNPTVAPIDSVTNSTFGVGGVVPFSGTNLLANVIWSFFNPGTGTGGIGSSSSSDWLIMLSPNKPFIIPLDSSLQNGGLATNFSLPTPVPEPSTLLLLGSGLVGTGFWFRRRKK